MAIPEQPDLSDQPGAGGGYRQDASPFPPPLTAPGRVLAYLAGLQVPGTPIDLRPADLAAACGCTRGETTEALSRLEQDGLVLVEPATAGLGHVSLTVLLAPPLAEYGVTARWADGLPALPDLPDAPPLPAEDRLTNPTTEHVRMSEAIADTSPAAPSDQSEAPEPFEPLGGAPPHAPDRPARTPRGRRGRVEPPASDGESPATQPLPFPEAAAPAEAAAAQEAAGPLEAVAPSVRAQAVSRRGDADETALARSFLERFERLLAETEEWRRRALTAEEHATSTEKQLRAAERRAESAEARLETAQERLRAWAELTQRMQQLSKQADTLARTKSPQPRRGSAES